MVDWTVDRNLRLWRAVFSELDAHTARLRASGALAPVGDTEFQYNREELFTRLREPVEKRLDEFDTEREAREIVASVKEAVMSAFGVNVLAIGLGGIFIAAVTTAALDVTGVLTATLFAIAGWMIIPARRRHLVKEFEAKISKLNEDLGRSCARSSRNRLPATRARPWKYWRRTRDFWKPSGRSWRAGLRRCEAPSVT
jgi:hypothetical protein